MSFALNLTPKSGIYLRTDTVNQQLIENAIDLDIDTTNFESVVTPQLVLDGSGMGYLRGSVRVIDATPAANMEICELPEYIRLVDNAKFSAAVLRGSSYVQNFLGIEGSESGIESVTITNPGNYSSNIVPVLGGPGSGATLVSHMEVRTLTTLAAGTGYVPGDVVAFAGGTFTDRANATVTNTRVVSATIVNGGTGGTDGAQTVTGTTGTGTKFQAAVTISGGIITAVNSISVAGNYTVNPTDIADEPVTGASLTGARLAVVMGVLLATPNLEDGDYTSIPANPVAQFSTTGSGTGATFTVTWQLLSVAVTAAGSGYTDASTLSFTGTAGVAAAASLVLGEGTGVPSVVVLNAPTEDDVISLDGTVFFVEPY